jgi:circadian clock protein KaiC
MATRKNRRATEEGIERVPSGIPGLDTVLRGGFLRGGVYLVRGTPGAGKTIFGNQVAFHHTAAGNRVVYVTLLVESHARMLEHMRTMQFFDPARLPDAIYYVSAFRTLEEDGLKGLIDLLRREVRSRKASLLVIDGFLAIQDFATSDREFKKFIHELQAHLGVEACTALLMTNGSRRESRPEHAVVDGLIELHDELFDAKPERELEVSKFRGTGFLRGRHAFSITDVGITIYPRLEALLSRPSREDDCLGEKVSTGLQPLDAMLGGGIPCATTTLLLGPSGVGKTTLGLHFLARSSSEERGLFFGFYDTPARLQFKAARLGINLDQQIEAGHLEILWQPPTEDLLDALGNRLVDAARHRGVRRLCIDGLPAFEGVASRPRRLGRFFTALANELRVLGVTTFYTAETSHLFAADVEVSMAANATFTENLILLRYVRQRSQLHRLLSIVKVRDSEFDSSSREFQINNGGINLADTNESAEALLSEVPRENVMRPSRTVPHRPRRSTRET